MARRLEDRTPTRWAFVSARMYLLEYVEYRSYGG